MAMAITVPVTQAESLNTKTKKLETAAKDEHHLRQLLVSSLGFVGAREPVDLDVADADNRDQNRNSRSRGRN